MSDSVSKHTVVRSYALVFKVERKLFKIDQWRLPLPGGLEVRALVYGAVILIGLVIAGDLPLIGAFLNLLPAPFHWGLIPGGLTFVLLKLQIEGRAPHRVLASIISWYFSQRRLVGVQKADPKGARAPIDTVWITPDWKSSRYRPAEVHGPALVLCRYPAQMRVSEDEDGHPIGDLHLVKPSYRKLARGRNTIGIPAGGKLVLET